MSDVGDGSVCDFYEDEGSLTFFDSYDDGDYVEEGGDVELGNVASNNAPPESILRGDGRGKGGKNRKSRKGRKDGRKSVAISPPPAPASAEEEEEEEESVGSTPSRRYTNINQEHSGGHKRFTTKALLNRSKSLHLKDERELKRAALAKVKEEEARRDMVRREMLGAEAFEKGLLRYEFLTKKEFVWTFLVIFIGCLVTAAITALFVIGQFRWEEPHNEPAMETVSFICLIVVGLILLVNIGFLSIFSERICATRRSNFTPLQKRAVRSSLIVIVLSTLLSCTFMAQYIVAASSNSVCRFLNSAVAGLTALRWLILLALWFMINTFAIDHIVNNKGRIRTLTFKNWCKNSRFYLVLQVPNFALLVITVTLVILDAINRIKQPRSYWDTLCQRTQGNCTGNGVVDEQHFRYVEALAIVATIMTGLFMIYAFIAWYRLCKLPWRKYGALNISLRLLILQTLPVMIVLAVTRLVKLYLHPQYECNNSGAKQDMFLDTPEALILISVYACVRVYTNSPIMVYEYRRQIRYTILQQFLWTERSPRVIDSEEFWAERVGDSDHHEDYVDYGPGKRFGSQPVFVYETMMKMLFWAELIYLGEGDLEGQARGSFGSKGSGDDSMPVLSSPSSQSQSQEGDVASLRRKTLTRGKGSSGHASRQSSMMRKERKFGRRRATAFEKEWNEEMSRFSQTEGKQSLSFSRALVIGMSHYGMDHYKVFYEEQSESKCVVAWGSNGHIVVSFRGTVKLPNMLTDMQCCMTRWQSMIQTVEEEQGNALKRCLRKPGIHHGFKKAMQSENIGIDLVEFVAALAHDHIQSGTRPCIRFTGHSLGGALAVLMSYEVYHRCKDIGLVKNEVSVYTYGCPGTCNGVAKDLYEREIPTCFHVINNVDYIAYCGPWLQFYKPGIVVLINRAGDVIVRPSLIESSLHHLWFQEVSKACPFA